MEILSSLLRGRLSCPRDPTLADCALQKRRPGRLPKRAVNKKPIAYFMRWASVIANDYFHFFFQFCQVNDSQNKVASAGNSSVKGNFLCLSCHSLRIKSSDLAFASGYASSSNRWRVSCPSLFKIKMHFISTPFQLKNIELRLDKPANYGVTLHKIIQKVKAENRSSERLFSRLYFCRQSFL